MHHPAAPISSTKSMREVLDRGRILSAALELVDRDGLEALSMRKLGGVLGVEAMALYHYFPSKAALVNGLVALVLSRLDVSPPATGDWASAVRQVARSFRDLGVTHATIFPLLATIGLDNPASLAPAEAVLGVLTRAGLGAGDAFDAFIALKSYVVGYTLWEIGHRCPGLRSGEATCAVQDIDVVAYPRLAELGGWLAERRLDTEFEAGLELVIDGLRTRLNTSAADPTRAG